MILVILIALALAKKQKDFEFDMKEGEVQEVPPKGDSQNLIMYIRPIEKGTLGELLLSSNNDSHEIREFYQTALFLGKSQKVNLKCITAPCKGKITQSNSDVVELSSKPQTLSLTQKEPMVLLSMSLSSNYERMVGEFKLENDEGDNIRIDVFEEKALLYGDEVQLSVAVNRKDCEKCKVYVVLSGDINIKEEATVVSQLKQYKEIEVLELNDNLQDYLFERSENQYKIKMPQSYNIFQINILGSVLPTIKITANDNKIFDSQQPTTSQSPGQIFQILLRKKEVNGEEIFITLSQAGPTKYSINCKLVDEPLIYPNQFALAPISEGGSHTYGFKSQYSDKEIAITVRYFTSTMNVLKMGECNGVCQLGVEDKHNLRFHQHESNPHVFVTPECSSKDNDGFCRFQIEVSSQIQNMYLLQVEQDVKQNTLKANNQYSNYIQQEEQQHLILKYQYQEGDVELVFTVSTHNVVYLISKDSSCYPVRRECAKFAGGLDHLVILRGDQLKKHSQFYVTLIGRETSYFRFMAKVVRLDQVNIQVLHEDETFRGVINLTEDLGKIHYFRVMINFDMVQEGVEAIEEKDPIIEFSIHSSRFQVALTINQGDQLPSLDGYDLITTNGYLAILPENKEYVRKGNFSLAIQNMFSSLSNKYIPYTLTFSTSRTVKSLQVGSQFNDVIGRMKKKYFSFYYDSNSEVYYVNLQSQKSQQLSLQVQSEIKVNANDTIFAKGQDSSTLSLEKPQLLSICEGKDQQEEDDDDIVKVCQAYILIENHGNTEVSYTINVWNPKVGIELHEGQQYQFNLEFLNKETFLYYKVISHTRDVQLHINSNYGFTRYSLEILDSQGAGATSLYAKEEFKTQHSKSISLSALEFCEPNCIIKVLLEGQSPQFNATRNVNYDDTIHLTIAQQYMDLNNGMPIQVQVKKTHPRYFIFSDLQSISPQSRLKLILHEIYGKGAICITFCDEDYTTLPSSKCDFAVQGNVLEITKAQITEMTDKLNLTHNPYMIIEISSLVDNSKFQISLETHDDINNHKMTLGIPTRVKMDISEQVLYQYFNVATDEDLQFKFIKISGTAQIEVTRCLNDSLKACESEVIIKESLIVGQTFNHHTIKNTDTTKYCELCTYVISIKTIGISADLLIIITTSKNFVQLPQNLAFTDYLDSGNDYNIYHYSFDTDHQVEIQVNQYNGQTEMWIGYNAVFNTSQYQFGPYNIEKQKLLMNTTDQINYYHAILPPREHLEDNYNVTPYANASHTLAGHYNDDDIYIIVKNKNSQASNYSITVTQSNSGNGQLLQDGVITQAFLSKQTPSLTLYHQQIYQKQASLFIKVIPYGNLPFTQQEDYFKIEISNETGNTANFTTLLAHSIRNNQLSYILPILQGMVTIKIHSLLDIKGNEGAIEYQFNPTGEIVPVFKPIQNRPYFFNHNYMNRFDLQISIVAKEVFMINENSNQIDQIYSSEPKFYETYIHKEGKIAIQVYNCRGDLNVSITQDYPQFLNRTYSGSKMTQEGQVTDILLPVKPGPLYLDFSSNRSVYKFTTTTYGQLDQMPFGSLLLGGDGQVNYYFESMDPDNITLKFKPLRCVGCDLTMETNSLIRYRISWGSSLEYSHIIGLCQFSQYGGLSAQEIGNHGSLEAGSYHLNRTEELSVNITVDKQSSHQVLYIAVVAQVISFGNHPVGDYELFYHVAEVALPKNAFFMYKHRFQEFVLSVSILGVFTISMYIFILLRLCCLCSFYRKARKLKKENLNLKLDQRMKEAKEKVEIKGDFMQLQEENNENPEQPA